MSKVLDMSRATGMVSWNLDPFGFGDDLTAFLSSTANLTKRSSTANKFCLYSVGNGGLSGLESVTILRERILRLLTILHGM